MPSRGNIEDRCEAYGVEYDPVVTRYAVFERDDWTCGICGGRTNPLKLPPHPHAPTVDHIVPLSKGGGHTWDNVQCAHLTCNASKGAKLSTSSE